MVYYVLLEKAKPYTRTRKGKVEHVRAYEKFRLKPGKGTWKNYTPYNPVSEQSMREMMEWYDKHKEELWGARKKRHGWQPMKESKKEKAWRKLGKAFPGAEMAGFSGASFASGSGTVGRENWPPQPMPNYGKRKLRKRSKNPKSLTEEVPFQGGGSGWVMS